MKKIIIPTLLLLLIGCTSSSYDIIIINGQIADGTGQELFQSNNYIKNEKIIEIGNKVDAIGKTKTLLMKYWIRKAGLKLVMLVP